MRSLENILHTIRQIFAGRQLIENSVKYRILCLVAAFIHLIFCIAMGGIGADVLCYYNICIVYLYCFMGIVLSARKKFKIIMVLFFLEVETHSVLASFLLGWDWGFMLYTVSLIPAAFYLANSLGNRDKHIAYSLGFSAFVIITYLSVSLIDPHVSARYDISAYPGVKSAIRYFNILIAFILQLGFSFLFALESQYMERLLEKENIKLGLEASFDPLTRLLNRRSMTRYMAEEIEKSRNSGSKACLVMLDIDDFKGINDTYGHDIGDKVLVLLADLISDELREGDFACRWGGEEFLLFVHGDKQETYFVADRIRRKLEESVLKNKYDGNFSVTATFGIAEYSEYTPLRIIIDAADEKLYYGKNHGKNQVVS